MRLVTFFYEGRETIGIIDRPDSNARVLELPLTDRSLPADLIEFLRMGGEGLRKASAVVKAALSTQWMDSQAVRLMAPIPRPGKIICLGANYREHILESGAPTPEYPLIFAKFSSAVVGPYDPIAIPRVTEQVDYEGELGVVIGRPGRHIRLSDALDHVAGYLVVNDVSARDYQARGGQWTLGKSFDTFAPMGPALVTPEEIPNPQTLDLRVSVGADVLQESNTRHMIFSIAQIIEYVSQVMTLEIGDVISTGTPAGVGAARKPPRWLKPGDIVRTELSGLGYLANRVMAESHQD
jgi:acylpyruvate hydrolase